MFLAFSRRMEPSMSFIMEDLPVESEMLTWMSLVFHLTHCATACAAPKLWRELK